MFRLLTIYCIMIVFVFGGCASNKSGNESGFNIYYHDAVSIQNGLKVGEITTSDLGDIVSTHDNGSGFTITTYEKEGIYTTVTTHSDGTLYVSQSRQSTDYSG